ncbi:hypothetical protein [Xenorhabdus griffiniae]|uniref:Uncharacterized protein n=1 Tax=Xenorhabdus griffiniae TaxID=351672 RepID=A0ABY9XJB8_9GAMM|nr:hypothetical protein [Xenorhabdus griffiniae]MBD1226750.1 hypothetical protein [Xenorhabdus griffiniae]MBE8589389.1 hypothetical protein [Xenorhabdus griffiniae]WMV72987.1 hypothetical protein QL128_02725 [Xenorhabdus griffiniae]WNH02666.1 hypothetical protein QL112_002730 [Xenorhabdus griffiniae]
MALILSLKLFVVVKKFRVSGVNLTLGGGFIRRLPIGQLRDGHVFIGQVDLAKPLLMENNLLNRFQLKFSGIVAFGGFQFHHYTSLLC